MENSEVQNMQPNYFELLNVSRLYNETKQHFLKKHIYFLAVSGLSCGIWDLPVGELGSSSLIRDQTQAPCIGSVKS